MRPTYAAEAALDVPLALTDARGTTDDLPLHPVQVHGRQSYESEDLDDGGLLGNYSSTIVGTSMTDGKSGVAGAASHAPERTRHKFDDGGTRFKRRPP